MQEGPAGVQRLPEKLQGMAVVRDIMLCFVLIGWVHG